MIDIGLNPITGDLSIVDFGAVLVEDVDQVAQNLSIRLKFIRGEWYLNIFVGIPYYEYFFIKNPIQSQIETFLMDEIFNTQDIDEILSFETNYENRKFFVKFECKTQFGTIQVDQELIS